MDMNSIIRPSITVANSVGLVTATGGNDAVHVLGTLRSGVTRTAVIKKIMASNDTGADITLQLGTRDLSAIPLFVQYLPDLLVLNGIENIWTEADIPRVEFSTVILPTVTGREGTIYMLASALGILLRLELDEYGM